MFRKLAWILLASVVLRHPGLSSSLPVKLDAKFIVGTGHTRMHRTIWPLTVLSSLYEQLTGDRDFPFGTVNNDDERGVSAPQRFMDPSGVVKPVENLTLVSDVMVNRLTTRENDQPDLSFLDDLGGLAYVLPDP